MNKQVHISIFGTCVLRDIFRLEDKEGAFVVDKFIQSVSPISLAIPKNLFFKEMGVNKIFEKLDSEIFYDSTNFYKKMIRLTLEDSVINYLSELESDYLLLDMWCLRYDIWWMDKKKSIPFTMVNGFEKYYLRMINKGVFPTFFEKQDILSLDDDRLYGYLDVFIDKITKLYDVKKIILFD